MVLRWQHEAGHPPRLEIEITAKHQLLDVADTLRKGAWPENMSLSFHGSQYRFRSGYERQQFAYGLDAAFSVLSEGT